MTTIFQCWTKCSNLWPKFNRNILSLGVRAVAVDVQVGIFVYFYSCLQLGIIHSFLGPMQEFDCPHLPLRSLVKVRCHLYHPAINSNHSPNMRDMCHPNSPDEDWVVPNACTSSHKLKMLERTVMFPLFLLVLFHPFHVPAAKLPTTQWGWLGGLKDHLPIVVVHQLVGLVDLPPLVQG
jgi:hypothetical protein